MVCCSLFQKVERYIIKTIARITNGNFRLLHRLFAQIQRIQEVNGMKKITKEIVLAARNCLVIGQN